MPHTEKFRKNANYIHRTSNRDNNNESAVHRILNWLWRVVEGFEEKVSGTCFFLITRKRNSITKCEWGKYVNQSWNRTLHKTMPVDLRTENLLNFFFDVWYNLGDQIWKNAKRRLHTCHISVFCRGNFDSLSWGAELLKFSERKSTKELCLYWLKKRNSSFRVWVRMCKPCYNWLKRVVF